MRRRLLALGAADGPGREAEIEHLRVALRRDDDVVGLDVAMHDARGVRVGERVGDLDRRRSIARRGFSGRPAMTFFSVSPGTNSNTRNS